MVNLESEGATKSSQNEKIIFKVVQIKFLALHFTNQSLRFDIFTVVNTHELNILIGMLQGQRSTVKAQQGSCRLCLTGK